MIFLYRVIVCEWIWLFLLVSSIVVSCGICFFSDRGTDVIFTVAGRDAVWTGGVGGVRGVGLAKVVRGLGLAKVGGWRWLG